MVCALHKLHEATNGRVGICKHNLGLIYTSENDVITSAEAVESSQVFCIL